MLLVIVLVLIVLFGYGPYRYGGEAYGPVYGFGGLSFLLILLVVLHLAGVINLSRLLR